MSIKAVILGFALFSISNIFGAQGTVIPCCAPLFESSFWDAMQEKTSEQRTEMLQTVCNHRWRVENRGGWTTTCLVEKADNEGNVCAHKAAYEQSVEFFTLFEKTYCFYETDDFYLRQNSKGNTAFHEFLFSPKITKESVLSFLKKMHAKYESHAGSLGWLSSVQNKEGQTLLHAILLCPVLSRDEKHHWYSCFGTWGCYDCKSKKDKDGRTAGDILRALFD